MIVATSRTHKKKVLEFRECVVVIIQAKLSSTESKGFLKDTIFLLYMFNKDLDVIQLTSFT